MPRCARFTYCNRVIKTSRVCTANASLVAGRVWLLPSANKRISTRLAPAWNAEFAGGPEAESREHGNKWNSWEAQEVTILPGPSAIRIWGRKLLCFVIGFFSGCQLRQDWRACATEKAEDHSQVGPELSNCTQCVPLVYIISYFLNNSCYLCMDSTFEWEPTPPATSSMMQHVRWRRSRTCQRFRREMPSQRTQCLAGYSNRSNQVVGWCRMPRFCVLPLKCPLHSRADDELSIGVLLWNFLRPQLTSQRGSREHQSKMQRFRQILGNKKLLKLPRRQSLVGNGGKCPVMAITTSHFEGSLPHQLNKIVCIYIYTYGNDI